MSGRPQLTERPATWGLPLDAQPLLPWARRGASRTPVFALRGLARTLFVLAGLTLLAAPLAAEDEPRPEPAPRRLLIASVATDPGGEAERLARRAVELKAAGQPAEALAHLVKLAEQMPTALVPLEQVLGSDAIEAGGALRWPARRAVNLALVRLPQAQRDALATRWAAAANLLEQAAIKGGRQALARLARSFGALESGRRAHRALAQLALESGRFAEAGRWLEAWLWLSPEASPQQQAEAVSEWVDALHGLEDAGGVLELGRRYAHLRARTVPRAGPPVTLDSLFWRAPRHASPRIPVAAPSVPENLTTVWSRTTAEAGWYTEQWESDEDPEPLARTGVHVDGDRLLLHQGRRVVRLDTRTGLERWRFPRRTLPRIHAPEARYLWHDIPVRTVTSAQGLVLAVLGEPGASGSYAWRDEIQEAESVRDEMRLRLVALDGETGAFRWATGGHHETHPVLGDPRTGVATPPLVVGDRIYIGLGQRLGAGIYHGACLDLKTGRPIWVRRLGAGDSGRAPKRAGKDRFRHPAMFSLAWGAQPAIAQGELCFVPHAGMAAGVAAMDGAVRWVRALPRYGLRTRHVPGTGPSARNVARAFGDAWILAPLDCPQLLCLVRGSGTLRWMRGPDRPTALPVWRDLLHVGPGPRGRPGVWLSALEGGVVFDARGMYEGTLSGVDPDALLPGAAHHGARGHLEAGVLTRASRGLLEAASMFPEPDAKPGAESRGSPLPPEAPAAGDLYPVGAGWLVVGAQRVALVVGDDAYGTLLANVDLDSHAVNPVATDAVREAMLARHGADATRMDGALSRLVDVAAPAAREAAAQGIARELDRLLDDVWTAADDEVKRGNALSLLRAFEPLVWRLPVNARGPLLYKAARAWLALGKGAEAVVLLDRWIAQPGTRLITTEPVDVGEARLLIRPDLVALALLAEARATFPSAQAALQRREQQHSELISPLLQASPQVLHEAIRRAAGTDAAATARRQLAERYTASGQHTAAAAMHADLRLAPAFREQRTQGRLLRNLARRQIAEADALVRAGELEAARSLLIEVARWAPAGLRDERGRRIRTATKRLRQLSARRPSRGSGAGRGALDVWAHKAGAPDADEISSVRFTGTRGPGAAALLDVVLIVRGLTPELYSTKTGERLAVLRGDDEGWFGGRLQSADVWVPGGGILVSSIVPREPADTSLVQASDWIRTWDGRPVPDLPTFIRAVAAARPGQEVQVGIWRGGKQILDRFTAGRRPLAQPPRRTKDTYAALWVAQDGRILFPSRSGLDWIDPKARTRTPLWRWPESGTVLRADVYGGEAYLTIERVGYDDVIVAVDLSTGRERWRQEVSGDVQRVRAVGSALWIDATEPGWAWALDRFDGSVRLGVRTLMTRRDEFRHTLADSHVSQAAPTGRGFAVVGSRATPELYAINTTTGRLEWAQRVGGIHSRLRRGRSGFLDPTLDVDGVVAVIESPDQLRIILPDPLGRAPAEQDILIAGKRALSTDRAEIGGPFSDDARVYVRGFRIHLVRTLWNRVTIFTVDLDPTQMGAPSTGRPKTDPLIVRNNERMLTDAPGDGQISPYVVDIVAEHDALYVLGVFFGDEPFVEVRYASHAGNEQLLTSPMKRVSRHRPVRCGERLFVPTDSGAEIFPLFPLDD